MTNQGSNCPTPSTPPEKFSSTAARDLGLIKADAVMGIPVSITGKSIYYDRKASSVGK